VRRGAGDRTNNARGRRANPDEGTQLGCRSGLVLVHKLCDNPRELSISTDFAGIANTALRPLIPAGLLTGDRHVVRPPRHVLQL
jgi:hypothetical protein